MKLANLPEYPSTLINLGIKATCRLLVNLPYYWLKRKAARYCERKVNDYRMLLDLHDTGIGKELFLYGTRERDHIIFLNEIIQKGMTVLDIGANIGYYSIMLGRLVGRNGRVYAVEPASANYYLLYLNILLNQLHDVVKIYNVGISNTTGIGKLYQSCKSNWHTFYPKVHSGEYTESLEHTVPVDVPVFTVPDFVKGKRNIDLIRMDIEGFEVEVLDSMIPAIQKKQLMPRILFEVHQPRYDESEHNMKTCLTRLFNTGYGVKRLASSVTTSTAIEYFRKRGYHPKMRIKSDGVRREIFHDISNTHALESICDTDFVRSVVLDQE